MKKGHYFRVWKLTEYGFVFYGKADTYEEAMSMGGDDIDFVDIEGHWHYVLNDGKIIW